MKSSTRVLALLLGCLAFNPQPSTATTVARAWNEENLAAVRISFPDPPVHARNLFHVSVAMYDAWAAYDSTAIGYAHNETATVPSGSTLEAARNEAISYAAYRLLVRRYFNFKHPNTPTINAINAKASFDAQMAALGYPTATTTTVGDSPAAVGNRVAASVLVFAGSDQARELNGYDDPSYAPVNPPLILSQPTNSMSDPNRWQPLAFGTRVSQNGIPIAESIQSFLGSHWGEVRPFSLHYEEGQDVYHDPGPPPYLNGVGDAQFKLDCQEVVRFSSWLDPDDGVSQDFSPGSIGNNTLGFNDGTGHALNPITGQVYAPNVMKRADFGRVLAEFWADGPDSETPPGHWNSIANKVVDHPSFEARMGGIGPVLDPLEWDVKMYLTLNGSQHDAAVAAWGCKRKYDYVRPISSIRYLAENNLLPLEPGLVETITSASSAFGERHYHLRFYPGKTAIYAWGGEPFDPETEYTGSAWILARDWLPYQRDTFITPAFAGYVSGHSTFSRAAAEVLTAMTGSPFFPGGISSHTVLKGELEFEYGPSADVTLQWATYYDAADQAGLSRLYGGIHVAPDDGPGRIMGSQCGLDAWATAQQYFDGSIAHTPIAIAVGADKGEALRVSWTQNRGQYYTLYQSADCENFTALGSGVQALDDEGSYIVPAPTSGAEKAFFQVIQSPTP